MPPYIKHLNSDPDVDLHPFQRIQGLLKDPNNVTKYGEKYGLGTREYELVEILPAEETVKMKGRHSFERGPTFA